MSNTEILRQEYNELRNVLDACELALSQLTKNHEALEAIAPDPAYNAIFVAKEAECNYFIAEAEAKLETLKNEIERLEAQARDN